MESYRTEEEQVEALRRWWDENGRSTLVTIVLVLAATFGWQGWQRYDAQRMDSASDLYQQMLEAAAMAQEGVVTAAPVERLGFALGVGQGRQRQRDGSGRAAAPGACACGRG